MFDVVMVYAIDYNLTSKHHFSDVGIYIFTSEAEGRASSR